MKGNLMRFASRLLAVVLVGIVSIGQPKVADASGIPRDLTMRCPQWVPLFKEYGLPAKVFSYIAWRESRCNPKAVSDIRWTSRPDVGLLQIQGSWVTVTHRICKVDRSQVLQALQDPRCNVAVAKYLYDNGGLGHWSL